MRKLIYILLISLLSCVSEIEGPDSSFVKIIGNDAPSQGFKLKKLSNGQLLVLGQTSTSAFDLAIGQNQAVFASSSLVSAPSISLVDESGNLLSRRIYPLPIPDFPYDITTENIENRAVFIDLIVLQDDSYMVIGELSTLETTEFEGVTINSPFYAYLDKDFNLKRVEYENRGNLSNNVARTRISVKQDKSGDFNMLFSQSADPSVPDYGFYAMRHFDNDQVLWEQSYNEPGVTQGLRIGWDHTFDRDGSLVVVGQDGIGQFGGEVFLARHDPLTGAVQSTSGIAGVGELRIADRGTILSIDEGFAVFYMQYPDIFFSRVTRDFTRENQVRVSRNNPAVSEGTFIRHAIQLSDGGYAVLGEIIKVENDNQPGRGIVIRIAENGRFLWQHEFDGFPQNLMETDDEGILILANPVFNQLSTKTTLIKLKKDGTL